MRYIVFSLFLISFSVFSQEPIKFTSDECLKSSFDTTIEHKAYLFGLLTAKLNIKKNACILTITYKELLEKKWTVDLCREPIHIKYQTNGNLSVYKKTAGCDGSNSEFCTSYTELQSVLQDHGLIFAKGDREKMKDPHGQVYCSYLLLNKYLGHDSIFSLYGKGFDIYSNKKESCELPPKIENSEAIIEVEPVSIESVEVEVPVESKGTETEIKSESVPEKSF